ncbi:MAG: hypothetical protein Q7S66_02410 [bacterium]|nr:hypothetical protein [bacterium]
MKRELPQKLSNEELVEALYNSARFAKEVEVEVSRRFASLMTPLLDAGQRVVDFGRGDGTPLTNGGTTKEVKQHRQDKAELVAKLNAAEPGRSATAFATKAAQQAALAARIAARPKRARR